MPSPLRNRLLLWGNRHYSDKVLSIQRSSLVAYWPLSEPSGSVATDLSGNSRNGAYTGVDLGQTGIGDGRTAPLWDGTNDYANMFSAGLASAMNGAEGSLSLWFKVAAAGVWTDATTRLLFRMGAASEISLRRTSTNGTLRWQYLAGGVTEVVDVGSLSSTAWLHMAMTWSKSADEMKAYLAGAQAGSTQTTLGTWSGTPTVAMIGANTTTPTNVWNGYLAHAALWSVALSAAEIARLATVTS